MKNIYQEARERYKPDIIKILFIAESPPAFKDKPRHFYIENVKEKDFLFIETMRTLYPSEFINYDRDPKKKRYFLEKFKKGGFFIIDAVDCPVNKLPPMERKSTIEENKQKLFNHIQKICNKSTKIILLKTNVFYLFFYELKNKKFRILNDEPIPFPSNGWQKVYREKLARFLLKEKNGRR